LLYLIFILQILSLIIKILIYNRFFVSDNLSKIFNPFVLNYKFNFNLFRYAFKS